MIGRLPRRRHCQAACRDVEGLIHATRKAVPMAAIELMLTILPYRRARIPPITARHRT